MKKIDQSAIRAQNLTHIVDVLIASPHSTRQEIARRTGLSLMSITNLVEQLSRNEAVVIEAAERAAEKKKVGRKAERLSLNTDRGLWLVVDLAGLHFQHFLFSIDHSLKATGEVWPYDDLKSYLVNLRAFLTEVDQRIRGERRNILGVAVVVPGPYDDHEDRVHNERVAPINEVSLKSLIRECLGEYYTFVDEDVKFASRAYYELSGDDEVEQMYYLYIGEGVGGAIVQNRQVVRGLNAVAGDPGRLPDIGGRTFEEELSIAEFARRLGLHVEQMLSEGQYAQALGRFAREEEDKYRRALNDAADTVARLLNWVAWLVDPHLVVMDVAYAEPMQAFFLEKVAAALHRHASKSFRKLPTLRFFHSDIKAAYLGAIKMLEKDWIVKME